MLAHSLISEAARRALLGSFFGTALESYDFLLYGSAAGLVFNKLFFPSTDPVTGTLLAFATFAVGFIARPIGGIFFGNYGDKIGRKPMLLLTLSLMGLFTTAIGVLPTYPEAGILAPILLTVLRFGQGIAWGGEWAGAVLVAIEHAPPNRRGFFGGFPNGGISLGLMIATGALGLTMSATGNNFLSWGWRIPFLLSLLVISMGIYVRTKITETPEFTALQKAGREKKVPILDAVTNHHREILLVSGIFAMANGGYSIIMVFMLSYGGVTLGIGIGTMLNAIMVASAVQIGACIAFGALSDRIGRVPVVMAGVLFVGLYIFPLFWLVQTKNPTLVTFGLTVALAAFAAVFGPTAAYFTEIFPTNVRYSGASIGYQIGSVFGGGLAPLIATALLAHFGGATWPICLYVIALVVLAVICLTILGEPERTFDRVDCG
jgi:MFS family permease